MEGEVLSGVLADPFISPLGAALTSIRIDVVRMASGSLSQASTPTVRLGSYDAARCPCTVIAGVDRRNTLSGLR